MPTPETAKDGMRFRAVKSWGGTFGSDCWVSSTSLCYQPASSKWDIYQGNLSRCRK